MAVLADEGKGSAPQVSQPAGSPISNSAGRLKSEALAGLEARDTADLEVCGTGLPVKVPDWCGLAFRIVIFDDMTSLRVGTILTPCKHPQSGEVACDA